MSPARFPRLRTALLACAALLAVPAAASAQTTVQPGVRVRILAPATADTLLTGTVVAFDSAALLLAPGSGQAGVHVPLATIRRLEVARQRSREAGLWGLLLGGAAGYALISPCGLGLDHASDCHNGRGAGVVAGAAVGMLLGNLFAGSGGERWRTVSVYTPGQP